MSEESTRYEVEPVMKPVSVDFKHRIGARVWIAAIQAEGLVNGLFLEVPGWPQYRVRYWHNGDWKEIYLPGSEVEPLKTRARKGQE